MDKKFISFRSPIEILSDPPSQEGLLIGDKHISKGSVAIIGGAAGVGKSRMTTALAVAGATGKDWFGYKVHRKFKTMIIQSENGSWRLFHELSEIPGIENLDSYIRISDPPNYGIRLDEIGFRSQLLAALEEFQPDVVVLDPWNSVVLDDKAKDFREAFDTIRALIGNSEKSPALVVIHHTRKPKENEKHSGRSLLNLFAGSYVIGSVARSAFVLQPATNDPEDDRVVFTCCKNNDGELGPRSVWHRKNGLFEIAESFDWEEFDKSENGPIQSSIDKVVAIAKEGWATRSELVSKLKIHHGLGKSASYGAIKSALDQSLLVEYDDGRISAA